jgi:hypothetical protein
MTPEQRLARQQAEIDQKLQRALMFDEFPDADKLESDPLFHAVPDRLKFERNAASAAWMERLSGKAVPPGSPNWQPSKDALARSFFKQKDAQNVSDDDLHAMIKTHLQTADAINSAAFAAAANGKPILRAMEELQAIPGLSGASKILPKFGDYQAEFAAQYDEAANRLTPYRGTIKKLQELGQQADKQIAETNVAPWEQMARLMLDVPKEYRELIIRAAAARAVPDKNEARGYIARLAMAFGTGMERYISQAGQGLADTGFSLMQAGAAAESAEMARFTGERVEVPSLIRPEEQQDLEFLVNQMRDLSRKSLDKNPDVRFLGMNIGAAAENLPMMATAFIPYAGPALMYGSFKASTEYELRQKYPEMSGAQIEAISTLAAPLQAASEVISDRLLFGRLPNLRRMFNKPAFTAGGIAAQLAGRVGIAAPVEYAEEFFQQALPEVITALSADVPDVNWNEFFRDWKANQGELVATIMPLVLLGAGVGQFQDFRTARELARDPLALAAAGYSPEASAKISEAANAGNLEEAQDLMLSDWRTVNASGAPVAEVTRNAQIKAREDMLAKMDELKQEADEAALALEKAAARGMIPTIRRDGEGWTVEKDGVAVKVNSREEAAQMAYATLADYERQSAEATAQLADEFISLGQGRAETFEISAPTQTPESLTSQGIVTPEEMQASVETYGIIHGLAPQESKAEAVQVFGFNRMEQINNVRTAVSRIFGGGNVLTALEEGVHGRWQAGLESGHYTHRQGIAWVRMAEQASGFDFLPSRDDADVTPQVLTEAISAVVQADVLGRRKDGKQHFSPGLISRGVASYALAGRANAKEAGVLATFLKSWREFWGQVLRAGRAMAKARKEGKLGEDFDSILDDLLGAEPQQRFEAQAAQEAARLSAEINNVPFSLGPLAELSPGGLSESEVETMRQPTFFWRGTMRPEEINLAKKGKLRPSKNFISGEIEPGLSVSETPGTVFSGGYDYAYLVEGEVAGQGSDGEPVLKPDSIKVVSPLMTSNEAFEKDRELRESDTGYRLRAGFFAHWPTGWGKETQFTKHIEALRQFLEAERKAKTLTDVFAIQGNKARIALWRPILEDAGIIPKESPTISGEASLSKGSFQSGVGDAANPNDTPRGADHERAATTSDRQGENTPNSGSVNPESPRASGGAGFSLAPRITPEQDAEHLAAVERGDKETAQRMVDEAAKMAGYNVGPVWHGTSWGEFNEFKIPDTPDPEYGLKAVFFTEEAPDGSGQTTAEASSKGGGYREGGGNPRIVRAFINPGKTLDMARKLSSLSGEDQSDLDAYVEASGATIRGGLSRYMDQKPNATVGSFMYAAGDNYFGDGETDAGGSFNWDSIYDRDRQTWVITDPSRIKSSDPVTYDDAGNVIPLSQRFTPSPDIRFSIGPRSAASLADTALASHMRKPEFREKFYRVARERVARLRAGADALSDRIRSVANIEAERKFRFRSRQRELIETGMAGLSRETAEAYFSGLQAIEDHPFIKQMLAGQGRLMSLSTARKQGRKLEGEYDDAPTLPPQWYTKDGGKTPDKMAQEMYDAGYLREPTPQALWSELSSVITGTRASNEAVRNAIAAVRDIEKNARTQAKQEADAWAKATRETVPTEKERQLAALRLLDAILSAFPPEIRGRVGGFVKLASLGSDAARQKEIERRIEKLDEVVEKEAKKHYLAKIEKTFEKAKPKKGKPGEKPQGKLGAQAQALIDLARTFADLDEAGVSAERAAINDRLAKATDSAEIADLVEREMILDQVGALTERTAAELEAADDWLNDVYTQGRNRWRAVIEAREEETKANREQARAEIGKTGLDAEQQTALKDARKIQKAAGGMALSWLSFEQVMHSILGRTSQLAKDVVAQARAATNQKTDAMRRKRKEFRDTMAAIFGTKRQKVWQEKLWQLSQIGGVKVTKMEGARVEKKEIAAEALKRIIEGRADAKAFGLDALSLDMLADAWADNEALPANRQKKNLTFEVPIEGTATETELSELQAVHVTMLAKQAQYTENMAGHGWTADVLAEIEKQLSDEAKAIRIWLATQYNDGWQPLNAVYSRMYGLNLPRIRNYAPGTFEAMDMMGQEIDPYGQGLLSEGGFRAGMLKTRGKHRARPRLEDALSVYWGHVNATEHFKAFAEFARDLRAVMNNAEVRSSITAKGGKDLLQSGQSWIEAFERNGLASRSANSRWDEFVRRRQASQAYLALAYNVGTLMKQSTAALGAMLRMSPGRSAMQFAKLVTGQLNLASAYRSETIQRRLEAGYSPEVRQAMAAMMAERPSWGTGFVQKGMEIIGMVDAMFTTASYAMAYDAHFEDAKAAGLNDEQAKAQAAREADATVAATAQPAEMMDRSLFEIGMQPTSKFLFMFASEARQKAAIALEAYRPSSGLPAGERATRLLLLHIVFPLAIQTVTNLWRDARDDDDDELFDSDNWRPGDYAKAMILGPLLGIPLVGQALNAALTPVFGGHYFANDPTQPLNRALTGGEDILDAVQDKDLESGLKGTRSLLWALALAMGGEKSAALGAGANILYDAFRVTDNALED